MTTLDEHLRRADEIPVDDRWEEIQAGRPHRFHPAGFFGGRSWGTVVAALLIAALAIAGVAVAFRHTYQPRPSPGSLSSPPRPLDVRIAGRVDVGGRAGSVAATNGQVWVATDDSELEFAAIVRIDALTRQVEATIPVEGRALHVTAGDGAVWVAVVDGRHAALSLVRIDQRTDRITGVIPDISGPIVVDPSGVWAVAGSDVVRIDPQTLTIEARIPMGTPPLDIAAGGGWIWVLEQQVQDDVVGAGSIVQIDANAATLSRSVDLSVAGTELAAGVEGVWVNGWRTDDPHMAAAFFVPSSGGPPQDAAGVYNFRPFAVAEGRVWFVSGPHDPGLPEGGICGLNVTTGAVYSCAKPRSIVDLQLAHDPAAFEQATKTLWVGEYESTFVTVIETQRSVGSDPTSASADPSPSTYPPPTHLEGALEVMAVTFPDGTTADLAFDPSLELGRHGVQIAPVVYAESRAAPACGSNVISAHASLHGQIYDGRQVVDVASADGTSVGLWEGGRGYLPYYLVFHVGGWDVLVPCEADAAERRDDLATWASAFRAASTDDGLLRFSSDPRVTLFPYDGPGLLIGGAGVHLDLTVEQDCSGRHDDTDVSDYLVQGCFGDRIWLYAQSEGRNTDSLATLINTFEVRSLNRP